MNNKYTMCLDDRYDETDEFIETIRKAGKIISEQNLEQDFLKEIHSEVIPVLKNAIAKAEPYMKLMERCRTEMEKKEDKIYLETQQIVEESISRLTQKLNQK